MIAKAVHIYQVFLLPSLNGAELYMNYLLESS